MFASACEKVPTFFLRNNADCFMLFLSIVWFAVHIDAMLNADPRCWRQAMQVCGVVSKFFGVTGSQPDTWRNGTQSMPALGCDGRTTVDPPTATSCRLAFPEFGNNAILTTRIGHSTLSNWCSDAACSRSLLYVGKAVVVCHEDDFNASSCCIEPGQLPASNFTSLVPCLSAGTTTISISTVSSTMPATSSNSGTSTTTATANRGTTTIHLTPSEATTRLLISSTSSAALSTAPVALPPSPGTLTATIAGSVGGGLIALLLIIAIAVLLARKCRQKQPARSAVKSVVPLATDLLQSSEYGAAPPTLHPQISQYDDVKAVRPPNEYESPSSPITFLERQP